MTKSANKIISIARKDIKKYIKCFKQTITDFCQNKKER